MARVEQRIYRNQYYQGTMSDDNAECILALLGQTSVPSLKHCIYDLTGEQRETVIKGYEESGVFPDKSQFVLGELEDHQTVGIAFMYYAKSCLLGDEVGLGKTVEVSGLCNLLELNYSKENKPFRFCFLTESTPATQIREKLVRFTGNYVGLLPSAEQDVVARYLKDNADGQKYSIVGTHALLNNQDFALYCARHPFDLFIIDESFILKKNTTQVYSNVKAIFKYCDRRVLLNATPLESHVRDFFNQLALLDRGYLPTVAEFERDFCKKSKTARGFEVTGTKNESIFRQVISLRYLARTRAILGAKFEGNSSEVYILEPSSTQRALFKRSSLYQLIADYPMDVDVRIPFAVSAVPKMKCTLDILSRIKGEQALIYCYYKNCQLKLCEVLEQAGYKVAVVNGDTKKKDRDAIIRGMSTGEYQVLVTNVTRGLDLDSCSHCIMYTIDKNPGKLLQIEGRITRAFDVCYRNLYLLAMRGREENALKGVVQSRISTVQSMTVVGKSISMGALQDASQWTYVNYYK